MTTFQNHHCISGALHIYPIRTALMKKGMEGTINVHVFRKKTRKSLEGND